MRKIGETSFNLSEKKLRGVVILGGNLSGREFPRGKVPRGEFPGKELP